MSRGSLLSSVAVVTVFHGFSILVANILKTPSIKRNKRARSERVARPPRSNNIT